MFVKKISIKPTYIKDNGMIVLDSMRVLADTEFTAVEQSIISLPPKQVAGNHKHQRKEAIIGFGKDLFFIWQDNAGKIYEEKMNPLGELYLFVISPGVPHAVINRSSESSFLYEYFNNLNKEVEKITLIKS